ncbi:hypothetical protein GGF44_001387 [Coemansia sp. RSA 1694]|nr:hypothetical protein GGF44_001387 [Coemansia sp. RSA 1694]
MRVSLAIALTVAAVFVAALPLDTRMKGSALREQSSLQTRDEGPPGGKPNNNDSHASQTSPQAAAANTSGSPPSSDRQLAKGPEPEHGSGDNRADPPQRMSDNSQSQPSSPSQPQPQHGSDSDRADNREQSRPQTQSQPKDDRNDVRDRGNVHTNDNDNGRQEDPHPQGNRNDGNVHENRSGQDSSNSRPESNGRPVHEHFEQVEHPGGNPSNVDRLTHDIVNDDRNGIHSNVIQHVSVSGNNVSGQVTDRVIRGGNGVFVNGRGNTVTPSSPMNPLGPNGPNSGNRQ